MCLNIRYLIYIGCVKKAREHLDSYSNFHRMSGYVVDHIGIQTEAYLKSTERLAQLENL